MSQDQMSAAELVRLLGLVRHPEGGFYVETFRSERPVSSAEHGGDRTASTAIYYLLERGEFSALHRVRSDEVWHHYLGAPVSLHVIDESGTLTTHVLGKRLDLGQRPQLVVTAGQWQAARVSPTETEALALCGCTVAPGFEFRDFELADRTELCGLHPQLARQIHELTR